MSIVTIQVGQCGNQLGYSFYDNLMKDYYNCSPLIQERLIETFFQRDFTNNQLIANSILVDMEPKVVQRCLNDSKIQKGLWRFDDQYAYYKQGGSGNNWALGYIYYAEKEYEETHNKIQKLLENIDYFGGFQVMQSLAGGTGSGLGAHIVEKLREDFNKGNMLNVAVWPYSNGEVILQNYNVLLTLNSLLEHSNGIIPIYNDEIMLICRELLKNKRPSYKVMNSVIAQTIGSYLFPCANSTKERVSLWDGPNIMNDIQQNLCQNPRYKILNIKSIPQCDQKAREFNSDLWEGLVQRIRQMIITDRSEHKINWSVKLEQHQKYKYNKSIGNMLFLRGDKIFEERESLEQEYFGISQLYSSKNKINLKTYRDSHKIFGHEKSVSVLSNNQQIVPHLERTLRKGTMMIAEKAYMHHYEKFGVNKEMFDSAFLNCESTLLEYKQM